MIHKIKKINTLTKEITCEHPSGESISFVYDNHEHIVAKCKEHAELIDDFPENLGLIEKPSKVFNFYKPLSLLLFITTIILLILKLKGGH